jgi:hypothetical protein
MRPTPPTNRRRIIRDHQKSRPADRDFRVIYRGTYATSLPRNSSRTRSLPQQLLRRLQPILRVKPFSNSRYAENH